MFIYSSTLNSEPTVGPPLPSSSQPPPGRQELPGASVGGGSAGPGTWRSDRGSPARSSSPAPAPGSGHPLETPNWIYIAGRGLNFIDLHGFSMDFQWTFIDVHAVSWVFDGFQLNLVHPSASRGLLFALRLLRLSRILI